MRVAMRSICAVGSSLSGVLERRSARFSPPRQLGSPAWLPRGALALLTAQMIGGHSAPQPSAPPGAQDKAHPKSGANALPSQIRRASVLFPSGRGMRAVHAQPSALSARPECQIFVMCRILAPSNCMT
jgi:hypothetical protein